MDITVKLRTNWIYQLKHNTGTRIGSGSDLVRGDVLDTYGNWIYQLNNDVVSDVVDTRLNWMYQLNIEVGHPWSTAVTDKCEYRGDTD